MRYNLDNWLNLRFFREADGRYYMISLEQDILGSWLVKRVWGGKTKAAGVVKITEVKDRGTAKLMIDNISERRISHGYSLSC